MDARTIIVYGVLGVLTGMLLVLFLGSKCFLGPECSVLRTKEGFQDQTMPPPQPRTCPRGTKVYTDKVGNINCCRGQVDGNFCEGRVECTFSSNASDTYKMCAAQRRRKYFGPINDFVKSYMSREFVVRFEYILEMMENFKPRIKSMIPAMITQQAYKEYEDLLEEEKIWFEDTRYTDEESIVYQEEVMYIITELQSLFASQKIANNPAVIQQQLVAQMCKK